MIKAEFRVILRYLKLSTLSTGSLLMEMWLWGVMGLLQVSVRSSLVLAAFRRRWFSVNLVNKWPKPKFLRKRKFILKGLYSCNERKLTHFAGHSQENERKRRTNYSIRYHIMRTGSMLAIQFNLNPVVCLFKKNVSMNRFRTHSHVETVGNWFLFSGWVVECRWTVCGEQKRWNSLAEMQSGNPFIG